MPTKTEIQKASPLTCPECGDPFQKATGLGAHRRSAHGVVGMAYSTVHRRNAVRTTAPPVTQDDVEEYTLPGTGRKRKVVENNGNKPHITKALGTVRGKRVNASCPHCNSGLTLRVQVLARGKAKSSWSGKIPAGSDRKLRAIARLLSAP